MEQGIEYHINVDLFSSYTSFAVNLHELNNAWQSIGSVVGDNKAL